MKSILDPTFQYVPAVETDLKKTFARIRREQERAKAVAGAAASNVKALLINQRKGKA